MSECLTGQNRRGRGRIRSREASTPHGKIVNISGGGMRLRTKKQKLAAKGMTYAVPLKLPFGERLSVRGETVWARRIGPKEFEIGVQWADPEREAAQIKRLVEVIASSHNTGMFPQANDDAA